ncbi:HR-like lesion-inducer [Arabidopsis thaliana x Arabidopsis arenosa]|uniref:HR-like lesion-inducer n=1 Tax=Arabidopsis thaliana x Arabidopsis arenosa TaxID=1240361 RepID=A0A8T2AXM7_9BRAS|nr:HR-like lesion-inducer [Arabidopsis thaliana x Arabidopsis arenosa]
MDVVQRKVNKFGRKVASFPHVETIGRALFASSFFLSAWHDYMELIANWKGTEDYWSPKFGYSGDQIKHLMTVSIIVRTLGGLIFIYGSFSGAFLLLMYQGIATMIHHDFYNHRIDTEEFGLLYLKLKRILNETLSYDTAYNFYKSDFDEQQIEQVKSKFRELADHAMTNPALFGHNEFLRRLLSFVKGLAVVGALLFFLDMKHRLNKAKNQSKVKTD